MSTHHIEMQETPLNRSSVFLLKSKIFQELRAFNVAVRKRRRVHFMSAKKRRPTDRLKIRLPQE